MMLAQRWVGQPVSGWWLSEKYDGVRAFWDGSVLRTRSWRPIECPAWFTDLLPRGIALDGELWGGRGTFQIASELSRYRRPTDSAWLAMRFMVFDAPTTTAEPVERRLAVAKALAVAAGCGWVEQRLCSGADDVTAELAQVLDRGGEGLMLRKPGHFYEFGRSRDWLKVKPTGID